MEITIEWSTAWLSRNIPLFILFMAIFERINSESQSGAFSDTFYFRMCILIVTRTPVKLFHVLSTNLLEKFFHSQLTNNNHIAVIRNGLEWRCFRRHFTSIAASRRQSHVVQNNLSVWRVVQLFDETNDNRSALRDNRELTSTVIPFWSNTWAGGWSRGTYR